MQKGGGGTDMAMNVGESNWYDDNTINSRNCFARYAHRSRHRKYIELVEVRLKSAQAISECRCPAAHTHGKVLDYGCGTGVFVAKLGEIYPNVYGYEPFMTERHEMDLPIFADYGEVLRLAPYRIITVFEVMEHLQQADLDIILKRCDELLIPGGEMIISVPIEMGPAVLLKALKRSQVDQFGKYGFLELVKIAGLAIPGQRSLPNDAGIIESHKGFDFRWLVDYMRSAGWDVGIADYGPLPIKCWYGNSQVYMVAKKPSIKVATSRHVQDVGSKNYSVLLPVYKNDRPEWFRVAVDSMVKQTLPPEEIVIAVDGPVTEELDEVIREYERNTRLFSVYRFEKNEGRGAISRKSIPLCRNEYIARMDADDYSLPERCEKQMKYLARHPEVGAIGSFISEFVGEMDNIVTVRTVPETHAEIIQYAKKRQPVNHPSLIYKKSEVMAAGSYRDLPSIEDYDVIVRMLQNGTRFHNFPQSLVHMRVSGALYKRRGGTAQLKTRYRVMKGFRESGFYATGVELFCSFLPYAAMCLLPNGGRVMVYKAVLRKKA